MPTITLTPSGKTAEVAPGTLLLKAIADAGITLTTKCTDELCSGECHVFVQEGKKSLTKAERRENEKLDTLVGVGSKSRLACQAKIGSENVTVEILGEFSGR